MFYKDPLSQKSFNLAIESINLYKALTAEQKEFVLSKQLLRSGTAVGALITEAKNAQGPKDFIYKLQVAQKECAETTYWVALLLQTSYISELTHAHFINLTDELLKILRSSILTVKQKHKLP